MYFLCCAQDPPSAAFTLHDVLRFLLEGRAHRPPCTPQADVNVASWNAAAPHTLASGGDDCRLRVWDLRAFAHPVADFKHHRCGQLPLPALCAVRLPPEAVAGHGRQAELPRVLVYLLMRNRIRNGEGTVINLRSAGPCRNWKLIIVKLDRISQRAPGKLPEI